MSVFKNPSIYLIATLLIISFIFIPTASRGWQMFDERDIYYNESLYPIPSSQGELLETIKHFGLNSNFESQNLQFSNIVNIRSNPIGTTLNILLSYLFKKNPFPFHLLSILIHLFNSALVWFIFCKLFEINKLQKNYLLSSIVTLIWALHPVNTEPVLMSTNWNSLFIYLIFFSFFLHALNKISKSTLRNSLTETITLTLLFFLSTMLVEYSYIFPIIIFFTILAFTCRGPGSFQKSLKGSLTLSLPYFYGLLLYALSYLVSHFVLSKSSYQSINLSLERVLWFSPQVFLHFFKLILFPKELSIYQSNFIYFAKSLFEPYALLASISFISLLILPVIYLLINKKSKYSFLFILIYSFMFSLLPFLHIIAPSYCIFSERYCYLPLFLLLFFTLTALSQTSFINKKKTILVLTTITLILLSTRTIFRLQDWQDSYTLYSSAIKTQKENLYKGLGYGALGYYFKSINNSSEANKYFSHCIKALEFEIARFKQNKWDSEPKTLKKYGLDRNTLILNAAFRIASIRFYEFNDNALEILKFYEPFVSSTLQTVGSSQLDLYAKLLLETKNTEEALRTLIFAKEKYPFSTTIIFSLSSLYLNQNDLLNAEKIITEGLKYYPNYAKILPRAVKLYWLKKDLPNLAKYEYLLGLRTHSEEAYRKSLEIYITLNKPFEAKRIIDNLRGIKNEN